jgi:hypothetical protein
MIALTSPKDIHMKPSKTARQLLTSILVAASLLGTTAQAQVHISINIAPPAPIYETVPVLAPGYIWAPGYWAWHGDRHIWVHGSSVVQRPGYRWEPDRWEQRNATYYRQPGAWARDDHDAKHSGKKAKKPKHPNNGNGNR